MSQTGFISLLLRSEMCLVFRISYYLTITYIMCRLDLPLRPLGSVPEPGGAWGFGGTEGAQKINLFSPRAAEVWHLAKSTRAGHKRTRPLISQLLDQSRDDAMLAICNIAQESQLNETNEIKLHFKKRSLIIDCQITHYRNNDVISHKRPHH